MKEHIDILEQVQKIEAPPFLLTRIYAKIQGKQYNKISGKEFYAIGISCLVILLINLGIVLYTKKKEDNKHLESLVEIMDINATNNLY